MAKCYIRNGVWGWPTERQIKALGDLWEPAISFQDTLRADRAKAPGRIRPEWLTARADMLRASARKQDTIHVATPLALAVNESDLVDVLKAAVGRNAAFVVSETGKTIGPCRDVEAVSNALSEWQEAKKRARTEPGRLEGVRVAAERRRKETQAIVKIATPLWRSRKTDRLSTEQIAAQVGRSPKTLYNELGRRPRVQFKRGEPDHDE